MYNDRLIFKTSVNDEVFFLKDTILVNFHHSRNGISTSKLNGGISELYKSVFNRHLSQSEIDYLENHEVLEFLVNQCKQLNIDSDFSTGLITLAKMENISIVNKTYENLDVTAISSAGVRTNASKAGDSSSYYEENGHFHLGTINTIILINSKLSDDTLMEAFMTATEAKTVALNNLKIPSQYSNGYATGTGTDGLCIFSNLDSSNVLTNAGKHSKLGELIGKCVIESVIKSIGKQVWITQKSQSNALVRLNRYKLDINDFYNNLDDDKFEFIKKLRVDAKIQKNVAITTSVLNLIDEVEVNLIKKEDAKSLALEIIKNCDSYPIKKLLDYWINYFM